MVTRQIQTPPAMGGSALYIYTHTYIIQCITYSEFYSDLNPFSQLPGHMAKPAKQQTHKEKANVNVTSLRDLLLRLDMAIYRAHECTVGTVVHVKSSA
jgi:hypothetical protein